MRKCRALRPVRAMHELRFAGEYRIGVMSSRLAGSGAVDLLWAMVAESFHQIPVDYDRLHRSESVPEK